MNNQPKNQTEAVVLTKQREAVLQVVPAHPTASEVYEASRGFAYDQLCDHL